MADQRFFQYLAGERAGEVLVFDKVEEEDGIIFVTFKDGSRCNEELILPINETKWTTQLMAEVESPRNCWTLKEEWVGRQEEKWSAPEEAPDGVSHLVQPFIQGRRKVTPIPPRPTKSAFGHLAHPISYSNDKPDTGTKVQQRDSNNESEVDRNDPVYLMMNQAKKFDTEVEMTLIVSLPTKSLYNVAKESFENGGEKCIEYIISNMDDKKLKDSLRSALKKAYLDQDEILNEPIASENN
jgi:hypothetical protein